MHRVVEEIESSNKWRFDDFAKMKKSALFVSDKQFWCRLCVPLVYAHWEGYVVSSMEILLGHINTLRVHPKDANIKFVALGLGDKFQSLSGKQSFGQRVDFVKSFIGLYSEPLRLDKKLETKANLSCKTLLGVCEKYEIDSKKFDEVRYEIDQLVNIRNRIAHGENGIVLGEDRLDLYIRSVQRAMDIFREAIADVLEDEKYLLGTS